MTLEQFKETIERLGTDQEHWPKATRHMYRDLIEANPEARHILDEQNQLDRLLSQLPAPAFTGLEMKVLNQALPAQQHSFFDQLIDWIVPENLGIQLWRPAIAACLPLVFGVLVGNYFSFGISEQDLALEYWDDELSLLSFTVLPGNPNEAGF